MSETVIVILLGALMTYLTRIGGDLVLSRFKSVHPRVEAGLNAVPAAVLTTLVAPAIMNAGIAELAAMAVAAAVALRASLITMFAAGAVVLIAMRYVLG